MKPSLPVALLLLASALGLGLIGLMISNDDSHVSSILLPPGVFYTGAVIAFAGALACAFAWVNKGD